MGYLDKIRNELSSSLTLDDGTIPSTHANWETSTTGINFGGTLRYYTYEYDPCLSCWTDKSACLNCLYYKGKHDGYQYPSFASSITGKITIEEPKKEKGYLPKIKDVIYNNPATIVIWADNTKTIVKCMEGAEYDKWMGLAMCIAKKALGDDYHHTFKKWTKKDEVQKKVVEKKQPKDRIRKAKNKKRRRRNKQWKTTTNM